MGFVELIMSKFEFVALSIFTPTPTYGGIVVKGKRVPVSKNPFSEFDGLVDLAFQNQSHSINNFLSFFFF